MTVERNLQRLTEVLRPVDHSSKSNNKYDTLVSLLAEHTPLSPDEVYASHFSAAKNITVRAEQSPKSRGSRLFVGMLRKAADAEAIVRAVQRKVAREHRPFLLLRESAEGTWAPYRGVIPSNDRADSVLMSQLQEAYGEFDILPVSLEGTSARRRGSTAPSLRFRVETLEALRIGNGSKTVVLTPGHPDGSGYETSYDLHIRDRSGHVEYVGQVKIGKAGQVSNAPLALPDSFRSLDPAYFSVGQDDSYYAKLIDLGVAEEILGALHDVAYNKQTFARFQDEPVLADSLLRSVPAATVQDQFHRMVHGRARKQDIEFEYTGASQADDAPEGISIPFKVEADSRPSTNIHVVIGSNGVGKTTLLKGMAAALVPSERHTVPPGRFVALGEDRSREREGLPLFSNLVFTSFSAFDPFFPPPPPLEDPDADDMLFFDLPVTGTPMDYIGLRRSAEERDGSFSVKGLSELNSDFLESFRACMYSPALRRRWQQAVSMFDSDGIFSDTEISTLADAYDEPDLQDADAAAVLDEAQTTFADLSAGHKIVLLIMTRLVETLRERSLVLLDEPEAHLHPPLLSAFMRSLAALLADRNAVAIIATHSPVVLQEVPRRCVWKLRRSGSQSAVDHPRVETFGEGIGVLTQEVFGLEIAQSGYHAELRKAVAECSTFDEVLARFGRQLGTEAQGIVQILLSAKASRGVL